MWFISVEVEKETSVPLPKKNPGSAPAWGLHFSEVFFEGLVFGGTYVRSEICVEKLIGLTLFLEGNLLFFFVLLCI